MKFLENGWDLLASKRRNEDSGEGLPKGFKIPASSNVCFLILKEKSALFDYIWLIDIFSEVAFLDKRDGGKI